jgi:hypothetical protein
MMKRLLTFLGALIVSIVLYAAVFSAVERPLTLGDLTQQFDLKLGYASELPSPKLLILAGSNGRYSHRCAQFSAVLHRPCANASIAAGIGLDFLLDQFGATLRRGDLIYMPLEYGQYSMSEADMHRGVQNAVLLRHQHDYLWSLEPSRIVEAYSAPDLPFLIRGAAEMTLARAKFQRRTNIESLTLQGDQQGHTLDMSAAYADALTQATYPDSRVPATSFAEDALGAFLRDAKRRGIIVVGGLPTVPEGTPIAAEDIERIRKLYVGNGQHFLSTPTQSRYPRSCFFDAVYHLNEPCQMQHSLTVAVMMRGEFPFF